MSKPNEAFWRNLLLYVDDGKVIPVVGPDLVTVRVGEQDLPLSRWLGRQLVDELELPEDDLPPDFNLNDVVSLHLRRGRQREDLYGQIMLILRDAKLPVPPALAALAGIPRFKLFVSLSFDALLAEAIAQARPGARPQAIAYLTNKVNDLDTAGSPQRPVVYQLFGSLSSTPDYVICDEDLLEFVHALQDKQRQPLKLFDELRDKHLLFLGCSFGDWMLRFLLRTTRGMELSQRRQRWDVLADEQSAQDPALNVFLSSFSADSKLLSMPAAAFVAELARRWHEAHPAPAEPDPAAAPAAAAAAGGEPGVGAVFISYASENVEEARRLAEGLRAARMDVWFDKEQLQAGDRWAGSIQRGIDHCSLFLPVISSHSLSAANRRRYFWGEWNVADNLARRMAPDEAFIIPVVVDDSSLDRSPVPDTFKAKQGITLPGGELTPEVAERLALIVRDFHRRRKSR